MEMKLLRQIKKSRKPEYRNWNSDMCLICKAVLPVLMTKIVKVIDNTDISIQFRLATY